MTEARCLEFIKPMLAHVKPPEIPIDRYAEGWVAELKIDGQRCMCAVRNHEVMAWSRPGPGKQEGLPRTLPAVVADVCRVLPDGIYDAEVAVVGGKSWDVSRKSNGSVAVLYVFDLLETLGKSLLRQPYTSRRELLEVAVSTAVGPHLQLVPQVEVSTASYERALAEDFEGLMLKRRPSIYRPGGRSRDWLKVKPERTAVLEIVGYKEAIGGPHSCLRLRDRAGVEITVKAQGWLVQAADQDERMFLGKLVQVEYQMRTQGEGGSYRHPRWSKFVDGQ